MYNLLVQTKECTRQRRLTLFYFLCINDGGLALHSVSANPSNSGAWTCVRARRGGAGRGWRGSGFGAAGPGRVGERKVGAVCERQKRKIFWESVAMGARRERVFFRASSDAARSSGEGKWLGLTRRRARIKCPGRRVVRHMEAV